MARLVGFIGKRPDLGARCLEFERRSLTVRAKSETPLGWGVGFYQGGEILLKRRPIDYHREVDIYEVTKDVKSDMLVAHVRTATIGSATTENTHPFRYRQWLFAHTGTLPAFDTLRRRLTESLPQFLQRDVRGETDSELLFHLFLSFLHDAGQLHMPAVEPADARAAIRSTVALVDRLCAEEGAGPTTMNLLVTTPDYLLAVHGGQPMAYRIFESGGDIERMFDDAGLGRMRVPDLAACRLALIASDFDDARQPAGWTTVAARAMVTFTRTDDPHTEEF